jgi:hypothetical protein
MKMQKGTVQKRNEKETSHKPQFQIMYGGEFWVTSSFTGPSTVIKSCQIFSNKKETADTKNDG